MKLKASDTYSYLRPEKCGLRIFLQNRREPESPLTPFEETLRRLGERHEKSHLMSFASFVDLSIGTLDERLRKTKDEVETKKQVIYQGALMARRTFNNIVCEVLGEPDFLILEGEKYIIRDSKISRRINKNDHPEVYGQLQIYGWLYEQTFNLPPSRLEVHSGTDEIIEIPYEGGNMGLALLADIVSLRTAQEEPFSPVGWSKCNNCGYFNRCWPRATKDNNIAVVLGVDQNLALALHNDGIDSVTDFLGRFDETTLAEYKKPWGKGTQRVGKKASSILRMAQVLESKSESLIQRPQIPSDPNFVMFDIEGLPPHLNELQKIYLWGIQVYGERPTDYKPAIAGFGPEGDRSGWEDFLSNAQLVFGEYGDIPFVHWHSYEKTNLGMYLDRFGDIEGIAERIRRNLLDLLPITKNSIALPLPSYSLKILEKYIGFRRTQKEFGGEWSMAKYIEATETQDEKLRSEVMDQILVYNKEDLEATWAVLNWLKAKAT